MCQLRIATPPFSVLLIFTGVAGELEPIQADFGREAEFKLATKKKKTFTFSPMYNLDYNLQHTDFWNVEEKSLKHSENIRIQRKARLRSPCLSYNPRSNSCLPLPTSRERRTDYTLTWSAVSHIAHKKMNNHPHPNPHCDKAGTDPTLPAQAYD